MLKKLAFSAALAAASLAAAPSQATDNLVSNGGFETTTVAGNFQFDPNYAPGAGGVTSWTSAPGYNVLFHSDTANTAAGSAASVYGTAGHGDEYMWASTPSPDGGNFVALDGEPGIQGKISQMIDNLTVGKTYDLSFLWGAGQLHSRTGDTTEKLEIGFGNDTYTTATLSNPSMGFTGWNFATTSFTATSKSQVLSFLSIGTPFGLPPVALLDGVSLTAAIPEASTWMMMMVGFGAIGFAVRRSRGTAAFA